MACEVALGTLGDTATTPGDEDVLGKTAVGIFDLDKCKLNAAFVEVFNKVRELTLWKEAGLAKHSS